MGLVFVALAAPEATYCRELDLGKRRRDRIQDMASNHAYDLLRRYLAGLPVEPATPGKHLELSLIHISEPTRP